MSIKGGNVCGNRVINACGKCFRRYPIFSEQNSQPRKWLPVKPGLAWPVPIRPYTANPARPGVAKSPPRPSMPPIRDASYPAINSTVVAIEIPWSPQTSRDE